MGKRKPRSVLIVSSQRRQKQTNKQTIKPPKPKHKQKQTKRQGTGQGRKYSFQVSETRPTVFWDGNRCWLEGPVWLPVSPSLCGILAGKQTEGAREGAEQHLASGPISWRVPSFLSFSAWLKHHAPSFFPPLLFPSASLLIASIFLSSILVDGLGYRWGKNISVSNNTQCLPRISK